MKSTNNTDERIAKMLFSSVYTLYLTKIEKKGRSETELLQIMTWLTGMDQAAICQCIEEKISFQTFFERAHLNPRASFIKGSICGIKIEEIENPLTKQVRCLDKLVDELAKGKSIDKILEKLQ